MADSIVALYNMALANVGSTQIVNDPAETSKVAVQCGIFFPTARDVVLRAAPWPFATRYVGLAQIPFSSFQPVGWAYAYQYPEDCLKALEIFAGVRQPSPTSRTPFAVRAGLRSGGGGTTRYILTDQAPIAAVASTTSAGTPAYPTLKYISRETDVSVYTPDVDLAIAWRLSALIAMPLAMAKDVKQACEQMASMMLGQAMANALNEDQEDPPLDSAFQLARG